MANKKNDKVGLSTNGAVVIGAIVGAILFFGGGVGLLALAGAIGGSELDFSDVATIKRMLNIEDDDDVIIISNGGSGTGGPTSGPRLVENPNPRVKVNGRLVEVGNLEFYLPYAFSPASDNGKGGVYTYNLINDDGWADVKVYKEKTSLSAERYLLSKNSGLDITDDDYRINGTEWVQAENGSVLAYATKFDGEVYAIVYAVKIDSDSTSSAMQMIPKTLRMKRIYK